MYSKKLKVLVLIKILIVLLFCSNVTALAMPIINYQFPSETLTPLIRPLSNEAGVSLTTAISKIFLAIGQVEQNRIRDANNLLEEAYDKVEIAKSNYMNIEDLIQQRPQRATQRIDYGSFPPEVQTRMNLLAQEYGIPTLPSDLQSVAALARSELETFRSRVSQAEFSSRRSSREIWFRLFEATKRVVDLGGLVSDISSNVRF